MTSAPRLHRSWVQNGPGRRRVKSRTTTPSREAGTGADTRRHGLKVLGPRVYRAFPRRDRRTRSNRTPRPAPTAAPPPVNAKPTRRLYAVSALRTNTFTSVVWDAELPQMSVTVNVIW